MLANQIRPTTISVAIVFRYIRFWPKKHRVLPFLAIPFLAIALRQSPPARARVETSTVSLALGANREGKERVKGKATRVQSTRIGSALMCVRRNVQHRELKLSKFTRFALITVMVAVPTGCVVSPPPLFSQNVQSHEKFPQAIGHRVYHQP